MKKCYANQYLLMVLFMVLVSTSANSKIITDDIKDQNVSSFSEVLITSDYNGQVLSCPQSSDASAYVYVYGGTSPFTYLWSTGSTSDQVTGLSAGTYFVTFNNNPTRNTYYRKGKFK